jgi:hypothetical protein
VVYLHEEATPPQVRPLVAYCVDEADELPLVCGESAVARCGRSAEESNGVPLLEDDSSKAMGRCVALHRKGLGEVRHGEDGGRCDHGLESVEGGGRGVGLGEAVLLEERGEWGGDRTVVDDEFAVVPPRGRGSRALRGPTEGQASRR